MADDPLEIYLPVYELVKTVPSGKVVTYGQVASLLTEVSLTARQVGTALRYAPPDVPWQRVVGAGGTLPVAKLGPEYAQKQKDLLQQEGVGFLGEHERRVNLAGFGWHFEGEPQKAEAGNLFERRDEEEA